MAGQAIVTIRDKQWLVSLANTPSELAQGLGGIPELPPETGMLFDLGLEQTTQVTTIPMLFPLDIAFLSEPLVVTEVYRDVQPGYLVTSILPTHYFLEVNAGELEGIGSGDRASVELLPLEETAVIMPDWVSALISFMGFALIAGFVVGMTRPVIKGLLENPGHYSKPGEAKKRYHGTFLINWQYGGYSYVEVDPNKPEHLWIHGMVDYADPDEVIAIAEREALPHVSLAGGFWEEVGYKGWGQKVSISEAKTALIKARIHVFGPKEKGKAAVVFIEKDFRNQVDREEWYVRELRAGRIDSWNFNLFVHNDLPYWLFAVRAGEEKDTVELMDGTILDTYEGISLVKSKPSGHQSSELKSEVGKRQACMREIAEWYGQHRREMTDEELRPIVRKYYPTDKELEEFLHFLQSPKGEQAMREELRLEAWRRGLAGPTHSSNPGPLEELENIARYAELARRLARSMRGATKKW